MFRERFGCFLMILAAAVFLLYAIPVWAAFQQNPQTVPLDWMAVALAAGAAGWAGWRLFRAGSRASVSDRPPSLAERAWRSWKGDGSDEAENSPKR